MATGQTWLDRTIGWLSPEAGLRRLRTRIATDLVQKHIATDLGLRHYEAASAGRRTHGWRSSAADANAAMAPFAGRLRDIARDLVRNNPYAESALSTIADQVVGWGIVAKAKPFNRRLQDRWQAWAGTTACDADGRHDFYGLQKLVVRTVGESGECLVRRRFRLPEDGLPIPLQLQVLEPDYLDTTKHGITLGGGGRIVYGIEFNGIGKRVAYWLYPEHPGNSVWSSMQSVRVPADGILHVFKPSRPGAIRGMTMFAPVIVRLKDLDEFEDATLMKQKIAACLAVIMTDTDGSAAPVGTADDTTSPGVDSLEPGAIINGAPGRNIQVVNPPTVREYPDYVESALRSVATGLHVSYEDLTGNYQNLPFSAARMSRIRRWPGIEDWRWRVLVPQFCDPVWNWAMLATGIMGDGAAAAHWTAPGMPMIEPDKEGLAIMRNIRTGIQTLSESIRERGYDPDDLLAELAADFKKLDELGLVLDIDPRKVTQQGMKQIEPKAAAPTAANPDQEPDPDGEGEDDE